MMKKKKPTVVADEVLLIKVESMNAKLICSDPKIVVDCMRTSNE
jgi:hypothetical protein